MTLALYMVHHNLHTHSLYHYAATEISQLNIRSGALSAELQVARSEGRELGEGVRSVEEEVRVRRREREKESGTRLADLQAEALRLRRELEV